MGFKIIVAGIGPGGEDFISPAARQTIDRAKILVGGRRALSQFAVDDRITFPITADIDAAVDFIKVIPSISAIQLAALDGTLLGLDQNAQLIGGELHWDIRS